MHARRDSWTVGIDIGGTFTDVVAVAAGGATPRAAKTPTRIGAIDASVAAALAAVDLDWKDAGEIVLGTTMVTNAIVEGALAPTALVATSGFGDTLEIGRQNRRELYRLDVPPKLPPLVPAERRLEVRERIGPDGRVQIPLEDAEIERVAAAVARLGVGAVAVSLLHAYANAEHEARIGRRLRQVVPHVALSHEIDPEPREHERTSVTALAAALMPMTAEQIGRLGGLGPRISLFHSAGGMASLEAVAAKPVALALSGPAAGAAAAGRVARELGLEAAIGFDMGGTTTDACLVLGGEVQVGPGRELAGRPLRQVMVAVESIGAGGGSLVRLDGRAVRVGPDSAGAKPGPACYGLGGEQATVTDADLVLGYLGQGAVLGGSIRLDGALARRALEPVARAFGVAVEVAAHGIRRVVGAGMIRALRRVTVERGVDARRCALVAFGGAGPMHAVALARELGIRRVIVPRFSSELSALGCLTAAARYTEHRVLRMASTGWDADRLARVADETTRRLSAQLPEGEGAAPNIRLVGLTHYVGQSDTIEVAFTLPADPCRIGRDFRDRHRELYGFATEEPWHLDALRIEVSAPPRVASLPPLGGTRVDARAGTRNCWFQPSGPTATPCHDRAALAPSARIAGPAIIEDAWSTIVLEPGTSARIDDAGHVHVEVGP